MDPAAKEHIHSLFGAIHTYLGYVLYGVVALHILGALKHQIFDREAEIQRMWF
jgi:cytochrome b561